MYFDYSLMPNWPALAWLTQLHTRDERINVFHGARVELNQHWFCEATWDGRYSDGGFDSTDIVIGTGARIRNSCVTFVTSGNTLDRLHFVRNKKCAWISNSLPALLSMIRGNVDPAYSGFIDDLRSIVMGLKDYKTEIETSVGKVNFIYFNNLVWNNRDLEEVPKPGGKYDFSSYSAYRKFLDTALMQLALNMEDQARTFPYKMLSTISSGYDSPTVSVLAKQAGCSEALCFTESQKGGKENGPEIARILGLSPIALDREAWRSSKPLPEVPFLVGDSKGMDLPFKAAEHLLSGRVLMTGYHGDKVWDKNTENVSENIVRGDQSGLSLSEYRLSAGFLNCAVPFFGVRQIRDLCAISNSAEMQPWDIHGDYSRPICRRIVEEAGVPRSMFGTTKAAAAFLFGNKQNFLSDSSMSDYRSWLKAQRPKWTARGMRPPMRRIRWVDSAYWMGINVTSWTAQRLITWSEGKPLIWRMAQSKILIDLANITRKKRLKVQGVRAHVFPWALEKAIHTYNRPETMDSWCKD